MVWVTLWAAHIVAPSCPCCLAPWPRVAVPATRSGLTSTGSLSSLLLRFSGCRPCYCHSIQSYNHQGAPEPVDPSPDIRWVGVVFKVITALFSTATLNFVEKIPIPWIATSSHLRTYSYRLRGNQMQSISRLLCSLTPQLRSRLRIPYNKKRRRMTLYPASKKMLIKPGYLWKGCV